MQPEEIITKITDLGIPFLLNLIAAIIKYCKHKFIFGMEPEI